MGKKDKDQDDNKSVWTPDSSRSCTDIIWWPIFVAFWIGMFIVAARGFAEGDPNRLRYGLDSFGNFCGMENEDNNGTGIVQDYSDATNLFFTFQGRKSDAGAAIADQDTQLTFETNIFSAFRICVASCPGFTSSVGTDGLTGEPDVFITPGPTNSNTTCATKTDAGFAGFSLGYLPTGDVNTPLDANEGCFAAYDTIEFFNICLPDLSSQTGWINSIPTGADNLTLSDVANDFYDSTDEIVKRAWNDLQEAWWVVLVSAVAALVFCLLYALLLRCCAGPFIYLSILLAFALCAFGGAYCYSRVEPMKTTADEANPTDPDYTSANAVMGLSIALLVFAAIILLITLFMRKRINMVIGVIKTTSMFIQDVPMIIFYPIVPYIFVAIFTFWFIIVALYLASAGTVDVSSNTGLMSFNYDNTLKGMALYHLFGYFWTNATIVALGHLTIALVCVEWYFCHDKKDLPKFVVISAAKKSVFYHFGSCCFGSFILAVVQTIRFIFNYIASRSDKLKETTVGKWLICCINCCLACFEKCIKFMNKMAYIQIAIQGRNFCSSAKEAWKLIASNFLRVAALNTFGDFFLWMGKIMITGAAAAIGAIIVIDMQEKGDINSIIFPLLVIVLCCYFVAAAFLGVYEMAMDTIFQCFVVDEEKNRAYFAQGTGLEDFFREEK